MIDKKTVAELFQKGIDCSQVVLMYFAEEVGISKEEACKIGAAFGGGMGVGETCGAVIGAMNVLGLKYGNTGENQQEAKDLMNQKRGEFLQKFQGKYQVCSCKGLLGYDISKPEEAAKIFEKDLLFDFCPEVVIFAMEILEEIL